MKSIPFLDIPALNAVYGRVRIPGSKSISNRALLLAGLCAGTTELYGVLDSDDTQVMLQALETIGCGVELMASGVAQGVRIRGVGRDVRGIQAQQMPGEAKALFLGNAGTVMRPMAAVLALLGGEYTLSGVPRMHERPIGDLVQALRYLGCHIEYQGQEGYPPLRISSAQIGSQNLAQLVKIKGDVSSQFLSALLLALPLVSKDDMTIEVQGELISQPYIAITLKLLSDFGVKVRNDEFRRFVIPAGSCYQSPGKYRVESDASSASYFIAAGAIGATSEQPLVIEGIGISSIQGDIRFIEAARAMGAAVFLQENEAVVYRHEWPLKAIELDCNHIPDAAMTLAVMALYANGTTRLTNIASWRVKETNRLEAMCAELTRLGAQVVLGDDFIEVTPPENPGNWKAASINTYDDHRMAMCFSLAALNPAAVPVRLLEPACVNKTYPGYFEDFFAVCHTPQETIPVITIDGPTASGKGTLASLVAEQLGYHYLDSGALYRVTALAAQRENIKPDDVCALAQLAQTLPVSFRGHSVLYKGDDVSEAIRSEAVGMLASQVAAYQPVRDALHALQRSFQRLPGLVADGRDMGTVIFPEADLKVFLTADVQARAQRRYKQLKEKGNFVKIEDILTDLTARDERDTKRETSPLKPAEDACLMDNSALDVSQSVQQVLSWWGKLQPFQ